MKRLSLLALVAPVFAGIPEPVVAVAPAPAPAAPCCAIELGISDKYTGVDEGFPYISNIDDSAWGWGAACEAGLRHRLYPGS